MNDAQIYIQKQELNVEVCVLRIEALMESLDAMKHHLISDSIAWAGNLCQHLGVEQQRPFRRRKVKESGTQPTTFEEQLSQDLNSCLEQVLEEVARRFEYLRSVFQKYGYLLPKNPLDPAHTFEIDSLHDDFDHDEFAIELRRLQSFAKAANVLPKFQIEGSRFELFEFIQEQEFNFGDSIPNIVIALRIFLTIGVSVASCERSFYKLKLIKTYLRSTMSVVKLNNLAILSIERSTLEEIDATEVIEDFVMREARRVKMQ